MKRTPCLLLALAALSVRAGAAVAGPEFLGYVEAGDSGGGDSEHGADFESFRGSAADGGYSATQDSSGTLSEAGFVFASTADCRAPAMSPGDPGGRATAHAAVTFALDAPTGIQLRGHFRSTTARNRFVASISRLPDAPDDPELTVYQSPNFGFPDGNADPLPFEFTEVLQPGTYRFAATVSAWDASESSAGFDLELRVPGRPVLRGVVQFERIPTGPDGLVLEAPEWIPAAGVPVEVVDAAGNVLAASTTGLFDGSYSFELDAPEPVVVRAKAMYGNVEVRDDPDPSAPGQVHVVESDPAVAAAGQIVVRDLVAGDADRRNGPFHLLALVRSFESQVRDVQPDFSPPPLQLRWRPDRAPGTRHVRADGIDVIVVDGLRGQGTVAGEPIDSDEFDPSAVAREYFHFAMRHLRRDHASAGGADVVGLRLDPRLALSEGWAMYFGCAALGVPDYLETAGPQGASAETTDLERNLHSRPRGAPQVDAAAVASVLWDLHDADADAGDGIALGFEVLWSALRELDDDPMADLVDFLEVLHRNDPSRGPALRTLLAKRGLAYAPGGDSPVRTPFPVPIENGVPSARVLVDSLGPPSGTILETSSRFFRFELAEPTTANVALRWKKSGKRPADLDLYLLSADGAVLGAAVSRDAAGRSETLSVPLAPGSYLIEVRSHHVPDGAATPVFNRGKCTVRLDH